MTLKESIADRYGRIAGDLLPKLKDTWTDMRKWLDDVNCSLANQAVPEKRRSRVSELSLSRKAREAGQGKPELKVVKQRSKAKG
ncbi:hypothetical protein QVZ43_00955 [Marinobacter sp. chi1]|uniref:Uncharacterized protein n=1 Tax=Marinobacter suaedae TaxID=3057675 RepID=A0ABT8VWA8_9GAMM|nr:hypothetical protein [Marinobacter sp. chi1]MDO3720266.1 hypothetical protein [Marinobacter sp. chi1]